MNLLGSKMANFWLVRIKLLRRPFLLAFPLMLLPAVCLAQGAGFEFPLLSATEGEDSTTRYSLSLQALILMGVLTILPSVILTMTSFTRIIIVLSILRQAIGTQQTPPNQVLIGLALFLTLFVMAPVLEKLNDEAAKPYIEGEIEIMEALNRSSVYMRDFMMNHTRESDLDMFRNLAGHERYKTPSDVPLTVLLPAFVSSELSTAFQIGFIIFLPFLVIDLVVSSVLMSLGMMMLSPMIISLPFKLLLFVSVDGWSLILATLGNSFKVAN